MALQLSADEVQAIWKTFKLDQSNEDLRNRLIENYLPLVKYNGERIWSRLPEGVELDDLTSAGAFGLMDAIDAFDMSRGVKFETYCVPRIRGAMLDELRTMDWVPRLVRSKASKLNEALKTLEARLGRPPADAEVAEHMQLTREEFEKLLVDANAVGLVRLNKKWGVVLEAGLHGSYMKKRRQRNHHTTKSLLLHGVCIVAMYLDAITGLGFLASVLANIHPHNVFKAQSL